MNQKRNRSVNWDEEEKKILRKVLNDYVYIIENKTLNSNTNKIKLRAWEKVHKTFNTLNCRYRQLIQLQLQWKAMKINARKIYRDYKKETQKSNGTMPEPIDASVIEVHNILNRVQVLKDCKPFDSDWIMPISYIKDEVTENTCETSEDILQDNNNVTIEEGETQLDTRELTLSDQSEDDLIIATPEKTLEPIITVRTEATQKNISKQKPKSKMKRHNYVNNMTQHSNNLNEEEQRRRLEMAEEEHAIKIKIHTEKLKCAILEREILELKKVHEEKLIAQL